MVSNGFRCLFLLVGIRWLPDESIPFSGFIALNPDCDVSNVFRCPQRRVESSADEIPYHLLSILRSGPSAIPVKLFDKSVDRLKETIDERGRNQISICDANEVGHG